MATTTLTIDLPSEVAEKEAQTTSIWGAPTMAEWNALLDSFSEGDEEDHRETVAILRWGHIEDRAQ